jgi:hypothetical protein
MPKGGGGGGRGGRGRGMMGGGMSNDLAAGDAVIAQMTEAEAALARAPLGQAQLNEQLSALGLQPEIIAQFNAAGVARDVAAMVPPGSVAFPRSYEAIAFRTPSGEVVRIAITPTERLQSSIMTQATSTVKRNGVTIEKMPYVTSADKLPPDVQRAAYSAVYNYPTPGMTKQDLHAGNYGITTGTTGARFEHGGQVYYAQIFDPGSLVKGARQVAIESGHVFRAVKRD